MKILYGALLATIFIFAPESGGLALEIEIGSVPRQCGISIIIGEHSDKGLKIFYKAEPELLNIEECQCPVSSRILSVEPKRPEADSNVRSYELSADIVAAQLNISQQNGAAYVASVRCVCEKCPKPM
jgi:hypothetical protein